MKANTPPIQNGLFSGSTEQNLSMKEQNRILTSHENRTVRIANKREREPLPDRVCCVCGEQAFVMSPSGMFAYCLTCGCCKYCNGSVEKFVQREGLWLCPCVVRRLEWQKDKGAKQVGMFGA